MFPPLAWVVVAVLAFSLPKTWSAAPAFVPKEIDTAESYWEPVDHLKEPTFRSSRTLRILGRRRRSSSALQITSTVALAISISVVLFLISTCLRVIQSRLASSGGLINRSLAEGGACGGADPDDEPAAGSGTSLSPEKAALSRGQSQLTRLQLPNDDPSDLTEKERASIKTARESLQVAMMEERNCSEWMRHNSEQFETKIRQLEADVAEQQAYVNTGMRTDSLILSRARLVSLREELQRRKAQQKLSKRYFAGMLWSPSQDVYALKKLADAYMTRRLSLAAATALAAAERVNSQGTFPLTSPRKPQVAKAYQIAGVMMEKLKVACTKLESQGGFSKGQLELAGQVITEAICFIQMLRAAGLDEPARDLNAATTMLKDLLASRGGPTVPEPPPSDIACSMPPPLPPLARKTDSPSRTGTPSSLSPRSHPSSPTASSPEQRSPLSPTTSQSSSPPTPQSTTGSPPPLPPKQRKGSRVSVKEESIAFSGAHKTPSRRSRKPHPKPPADKPPKDPKAAPPARSEPGDGKKPK